MLLRTACSTPLSPRTFLRICTLAWLSASSTGLARSRRKWLAQYRCGTSGNSPAIPVTKASCLSEIQSFTGLPNRSAHWRAWAIKRRTSDAVAESNASANQTRLPVAFRGPRRGSRCLFSGWRPSIERMISSTPEIMLGGDGLGVLLSGGEHRLVAADGVGDGRPGEGSMAKPSSNSPRIWRDRPQWRAKRRWPIQQKTSQADAPTGQGDGHPNLRVRLVSVMPRAAWIGAVVESFADTMMDGALEGEEDGDGDGRRYMR